jgi:hypothetical protein
MRQSWQSFLARRACLLGAAVLALAAGIVVAALAAGTAPSHAGAPAPARLAALAMPADPPSNTAPPAVTGYVGIGLTLTASTGTWANNPQSFAYAWQRCDPSGNNCAPIGGATSASYTITGADSGATLAVVVTATDADGSASAASAATGVVPPPGACPVSGATDTWTGGVGTSNWADAGNWSTGAPPGSGDFVCLPADATGTGPIAVPASSLGRLLSFKPLTLAAGVTTAQGADFEANAQLQGGSLAGPSVVIGPAATVTVTGGVSLAGPVAVTNAGTIQIADGGSVSAPVGSSGACASPRPSFLNSGTVNFTDGKGAQISLYCANLVNQAGGTLTKTGTAGYDTVTGTGTGTVENDGTVTSQAGVLGFSGQGSTSSAGTFTGAGTGHVDLGPGRVTTGAQTTLGNGVYVTGTLAGAVTVPAGVTLTVGNDPASPLAQAGTLDAPVTGAGTLAAAGTYSNGNLYYATVAADLNVAAVALGSDTQFAVKPDGTTTSIGAGTTVTVTGGVNLAGPVAVANAGTVQIGDGGSLRAPVSTAGGCAFPRPSFLNSGTVNFTDAKGAQISLYCANLVNQASGTITKTGSATLDEVSGAGGSIGSVENDGTVIAQAGVLDFSSAPGPASPGTFTGNSGGHVDLGPATVTASAQTTFGPGVWVTGVLAGAVAIPAGVTLHLGNDPASPLARAGTLDAPVTGAGTLAAAGIYSNYNIYYATIAADLNVAAVTLGADSQFATKPDGTATNIGPTTTVTVTAGAGLAGAVTVANAGTVQLANGGSLSSGSVPCGPSPVLQNSGLIDFTASTTASVHLYCGKLVNQTGATITKSGPASAVDIYGGGESTGTGTVENDGTVTSQNGVLDFSGTPGPISAGTFTGSSGGHVDLGPGTITASAQTTFGNGVYVTGTLAGAAMVPAGVTLTVGNDPAGAPWQAGTLDAPVTGAGTLAAAGAFNNGTTYYANIAADLNNAAVTLGPVTQLAVKPDGTATNIGAGTVVTVTSRVNLAGPVTVANAGTVQLADGGSVAATGPTPCAATGPSFLNSGTVDFTDSTGAGVNLVCGALVNQTAGVIVKTGSATLDQVNAGGSSYGSNGTAENDGTIISQAGVLDFSGNAGPTSPGTFAGTGTGHVDLGPGSVGVSPNTTFGNGVWITGQVTGNVGVPADVTLNVGYDPSSSAPWLAGTLVGTVSGNGTLNAGGNLYLGQYPEMATVTGDLDVASAIVGPYSEFGVKPDGTATVVNSDVTMTATPVLAPGLTLINQNVMDFGANDYFTCATCTFYNLETMQVNNPDGAVDHSFNIDAGTFANDGMIDLTGYQPGSSINFGSGATVKKMGQAEADGLKQPSWVEQVQNGPVAAQVAKAIGQAGLVAMGANASMYLAAHLLNMGVASCANANLRLAEASGSLGACIVVGPDGTEDVALTVGGGGVVPFPGGEDWKLSKLAELYAGAEGTVDAGAQIMWEVSDAGTQENPFNITSNLDGPAWCENGSLTVVVGLVGQHCWGLEDKVPFDLGSLPALLPGIHSFYLGASTGGGAGGGAVLSYSVLIGCSKWYDLTSMACPPVNVGAPVITVTGNGTAAVGQTLSADHGAWDSAGPITGFFYQWESCTTSALSSCEPISNAISSDYTIQPADENNYITVKVTATNAGGSNTSPLATPVFVP